MASRRITNGLPLFPTYIKFVGILLIAFSVILTFIIKPLNFAFAQEHPFWIRAYFYDALFIGLSMIAFSKDKIEDELTNLYRLRAAFFAFTTAILAVIINPIIDLLFSSPPENPIGYSIVLNMLLMYIGWYYTQKLGWFFYEKRLKG
jgi:L-asparagine transporter-like permease